MGGFIIPSNIYDGKFWQKYQSAALTDRVNTKQNS